jgi:hypothetical protein
MRFGAKMMRIFSSNGCFWIAWQKILYIDVDEGSDPPFRYLIKQSEMMGSEVSHNVK